jgi:hypothetical protein
MTEPQPSRVLAPTRLPGAPGPPKALTPRVGPENATAANVSGLAGKTGGRL